MKLDPLKQSAIIGCAKRRIGRIRQPLVKKCAGCGREVVLTKENYKEALEQAKEMGQETVIVCRGCASPWLDEAAAGNVIVQGPESVIESDGIVEDLVERRKRFIAGLN